MRANEKDAIQLEPQSKDAIKWNAGVTAKNRMSSHFGDSISSNNSPPHQTSHLVSCVKKKSKKHFMAMWLSNDDHSVYDTNRLKPAKILPFCLFRCFSLPHPVLIVFNIYILKKKKLTRGL